jgi:hypothetical protein
MVATSTADVAAWDTSSGPPPSRSAAPNRERDDHPDLPGAGADQEHEQVGHEDPERYAEGHLHRAAAALPESHAERDHGGHGREERPRVPEELGRREPGQGRGHGRVQDRARADEERLAPALEAGARPRCRLRAELLAAQARPRDPVGHQRALNARPLTFP